MTDKTAMTLMVFFYLLLAVAGMEVLLMLLVDPFFPSLHLVLGPVLALCIGANAAFDDVPHKYHLN